MDELVSKLQNIIPDIKFAKGSSFCWSPATKTISYLSGVQSKPKSATWSLLHETGHAKLQHRGYTSDMDLVMLEVAAWQKAKEIGKSLNITIDENHIQDCIDTYRDWLHQRSTCPRCGLGSLQINVKQYQCHNCGSLWNITAARFCRPYRLTKTNTKRPLTKHSALTTTFQ